MGSWGGGERWSGRVVAGMRWFTCDHLIKSRRTGACVGDLLHLGILRLGGIFVIDVIIFLLCFHHGVGDRCLGCA